MTVVGPQHKSFPPAAWGTSLEQLGGLGLRLSDLATPLLTLDDGALDHNTARMARWAAEQGVELAPHGKTTMAPALWQRLLDAGAWGITLATPWQVEVAVRHGVPRVLLANEALDPVGLDLLVEASRRARVIAWVDSAAGVDAAAAAARRGGDDAVLELVVDLGGAGGRTGARGIPAAVEVAHAVRAQPQLRLVGVGGYEGALAHDRSTADLETVRSWCAELLRLHQTLTERYEHDEPLLTASGSAYFDVVAEALAPARGTGTAVVLRPGAAQVHDSVHYLHLSPLAGTADALRPAMHGWARVLSSPEPGLAILDGGKRDFSFDIDLPVLERPLPPPDGTWTGTVTALNDQHAFVRTSGAAPVATGDLLRLGLSHPCTALDRWRLIPLVADADAEDPAVVGAVETWF